MSTRAIAIHCRGVRGASFAINRDQRRRSMFASVETNGRTNDALRDCTMRAYRGVLHTETAKRTQASGDRSMETSMGRRDTRYVPATMSALVVAYPSA